MVFQHAIELFLDPQAIPKHHVRRDSGRLIDPFIARLPELIADLRAPSPAATRRRSSKDICLRE